MIEVILRDYLNEKLNVPVEFTRPTNENIMEYVLLQKAGSGRENFLDRATFVVQSYSDTLYGAMTLNESVKTALLGDGMSHVGIAGELNNISKCSLNGDYEYSDTTRKINRYQAVFDFIYMD